jgi:hypothetical protein
MLACLLVGSVQSPVHAADPVRNVAAPTITGYATYGWPLTATPGTWEPADGTAYSWRWLRDGAPIAGALAPTYRTVLADIGHRISVEVTAHHEGLDDTAVASAPTAAIRRASFRLLERPQVTGVRRYLRTLTATPGRWWPAAQHHRVQWLRDGRPIAGATGWRYRTTHLDVGHLVAVRISSIRAGYHLAAAASANARIDHRVPLRRTVHYRVETRGRITTSVTDFRRLAHATLNDPRGWRGAAGIAFREVRSGGSMTLVLAEASRVPRFSSACSSQWSCRVGRYVIINQYRWKHASSAWWQRGGTLRDYRHMVVNHETGHWLGHGHRGCPARGALAPVMQQQSKSLGGCRINPWPTPREWFAPRF